MKMSKFGIGPLKGILFLILYLGSLILIYFFNNLFALFALLIITIIQYYNNVHDIMALRKEIDNQIGGWYGPPFTGYSYIISINNFIQKCKKWLFSIDKQIKFQFTKGWYIVGLRLDSIILEN